MPEGPEVISLVNWLNYNIKNKNLLEIKIISGRYKKNESPIGWDLFKKSLPLKIKKINCKGKFIWWEFKNSDLTLWNTLGMSGWWYQENTPHNHIEFKISKSNPFIFACLVLGDTLNSAVRVPPEFFAFFLAISLSLPSC